MTTIGLLFHNQSYYAKMHLINIQHHIASSNIGQQLKQQNKYEIPSSFSHSVLTNVATQDTRFILFH